MNRIYLTVVRPMPSTATLSTPRTTYAPLPDEALSLAAQALGPMDRRVAELADLIRYLEANWDNTPQDYPGPGKWRDAEDDEDDDRA